jgi:alanine dehydrogenase
MTLILSNNDVEAVLTMEICLEALEDAYRDQAAGRAINQIRYDTEMPMPEMRETRGRHEFKTMVGILPTAGVSAIRLSASIQHEPVIQGIKRRDKIPAAGGRWVGLVQLYDFYTGEPLAFFPDGYLQRTRVAGTSGLAAKYMARKDSSVLALLGSGWQARGHAEAMSRVRRLQRIKVYSPNRDHRVAFAQEMTPKLDVEIEPVSSVGEALEGANIVVCATNSIDPVVKAEWLREGMHVTDVKKGEIDAQTRRRMDVIVVHQHRAYETWVAGEGPFGIRETPLAMEEEYKKYSLLEDVIVGKAKGRHSEKDITYFWNNAGLGIQFAAVGARVYQEAKERNLGRHIPTEWLTQEYHT